MTWRFVPDDYVKDAKTLNGFEHTLVFGESNHDIYTVAYEGVIVGLDGAVHVLPKGEKVKVLGEPVDQPWCYLVQSLSVKLPGGEVGILRESAPVAVLDTDYQQQLKDEIKK